MECPLRPRRRFLDESVSAFGSTPTAGADTPPARRGLTVCRRGSTRCGARFHSRRVRSSPGFLARVHRRKRVAVACVVREAVGDDVDLVIEVRRRWAPSHAVARTMEEFRPFWYGEPVSPTNLDARAEVRRRVRLPVVAGEELCTKGAFRQVLESRRHPRSGRL